MTVAGLDVGIDVPAIFFDLGNPACDALFLLSLLGPL